LGGLEPNLHAMRTYQQRRGDIQLDILLDILQSVLFSSTATSVLPGSLKTNMDDNMNEESKNISNNSRGTTSRESSFGLTSAGVNILSQKVSRALELRTDTPAMTSALDALAYLSATTATSSSSSGSATASGNPQQAASSRAVVSTVIDPKMVRSILEKDALNQALLYQNQLESLLRSIAEMKRGISNISAIVDSVRNAIEIDVCCGSESMMREESDSKLIGTGESQLSAPLIPKSNEDDAIAIPAERDDNDDDNNDIIARVERKDINSISSTKAIQAEQALARKLHDAFVARDMCRRRYETLNQFLEKFQMTEQENDLLQNYNFGQPQEQSPAYTRQYLGTATTTMLMSFDPDSLEGFQFLDTLDKVRTIRQELSKTLLVDDYGTAMALPHSTASEQLGATSALRMMEKLAQKQEMAYERLYHFLQAYLNLNTNVVAGLPPSAIPTSSSMQHQQQRILDRVTLTQQPSPTTMLSDDIVEERLAHPFTKRALTSLSHVPTFYSHCLELIATSRRAEVTRRFLLALTSGYDNVAPIEMRAHDPVGYVGDMLAFAYRSFSVESDLAIGLFVEIRAANPHGGLEQVLHQETNPDVKNQTTSLHTSPIEYPSSITKSPLDVVAHCMSGLARPLKSRILQVVSSLSRRPEDESYDIGGDGLSLNSSSNDGALHDFALDEVLEAIPTSARNRLAALYSVCGLLLFYQHQMGKTLERLENNSSETTHSSAVTSQGEDAAAVIGSNNPLIQTVIECLQEACESYVASLKVYCAMLKTYASMADESEADLTKAVVSSILDTRNSSPGFEPYILSLNPESASALSLELLFNTMIDAALSSCLKFEDAITLKQTVDAAKKAGLNKENAEKWQAEIGFKEKELVEDLVGKATGKMLYDCGLGPLAHALWSREMSGDTNPIASYPGLSKQELQMSLQVSLNKILSYKQLYLK